MRKNCVLSKPDEMNVQKTTIWQNFLFIPNFVEKATINEQRGTIKIVLRRFEQYPLNQKTII